MNERAKVSDDFLAELGWLTIQWSRLEAYVDIILAYLLKYFNDDQNKIASSFRGRVRYIRRTLRQHAFINVFLEANTLLDTVLSASRRRNDLVHGIVTNWSSHISADQTILRTTSAGYVAIQDVPISKSDLIELSRDINILSVKLFSLQENVKSIARFLNGDDKFWMTATLQVPDG